MRKIATLFLFLLLPVSIVLFSCGGAYSKESVGEDAQPRHVWTAEQANEWYSNWDWLVGANFSPSTAINQLEMWQAQSFDPETIDRELGYAQEIGFNSMRVYLHHVAWQQDAEGFKSRIDDYLAIAHKHGISTMFVFFDDCWNPTYEAGPQPAPKPGIHNSGWLQDPGDVMHTDPSLVATLEAYVKDIMTTFANDERILLWDLYNEPGNSKRENESLPLLEKVFQWGREANPSQPISSGIWKWKLTEITELQLQNSDVITYHSYEDADEHRSFIETLKQHTSKPLLCTEYMARSRNSLFQNILPILKEYNIAAYNWGLVDGKTNTKYAWDTPLTDGAEPDVWFHEVFRKDGSPYMQEEVDVIKALTER